MKAKSLVAVAITLLGLICQQAMLAAAPPIFVLIYIDDLYECVDGQSTTE